MVDGMDLRMPNQTAKVERVMFHFGTEPPALSVITVDGDTFWFEIEDDYQILALVENASVHISKKFRLLKAREK